MDLASLLVEEEHDALSCSLLPLWTVGAVGGGGLKRSGNVQVLTFLVLSEPSSWHIWAEFANVAM